MFATWNVRTLRDSKNYVNLERRSAVITGKLKQCYIDIEALSETHLSGQQSFEEGGAGYTSFHQVYLSGNLKEQVLVLQ